jgi:hypothetical protein
VQETRKRSSAIQRRLRLFGLFGKSGGCSLILAAILIVVGAALLAAFPHQGAATTAGAALWLIGGIAIGGWLRIMRTRKRDSA